MKIKLNVGLGGHPVGTIIDVPDTDRTPLEKFWRDRLKDATIDNCCEIVENKPRKTRKVEKLADEQD